LISAAELNEFPAPRFWRRVFCGLYEQLVLLGVIALTFLLPNLLLGVLFNLSLPNWLTFIYLYGVLGAYFVWYWRRTGQTLAMQTWRIRMVSKDGGAITRNQAIKRYFFGSLWLAPCMLLQWIFELHRWQILEMLFAVALFLWPLSIYLQRSNPLQRQGLPDRWAGTKLVELPKHLVKLS
jgi:uncharacterized RDD family membrane protein YckC